MAPAPRPVLALALVATLGVIAGCIGIEDPPAPTPARGAPDAAAPTGPPTLPPPPAAGDPVSPPDGAPVPEAPSPATPAPTTPTPTMPTPTAPVPPPATTTPTPEQPSSPSSGSDAPTPQVPDRPVRLRGGADAAPDRTSARVPTYALASDGSTLAAHVVAVREARLVIDSFLRVENLDVRERAATLTGEARNATGVSEARLAIWRASTGAGVGTLDLLAPGASLTFTLAPGEVLEGRYSLAVGPTGGDGFEARLSLGVAP